MEPAAMRNTAVAKARLEAQLAELEGRKDRIARDLAEPLNSDSSEQAGDGGSLFARRASRAHRA